MKKPTLYDLKMTAICGIIIIGLLLMAPGLIYFWLLQKISGEDILSEIF
jgi:hypothetical protein